MKRKTVFLLSILSFLTINFCTPVYAEEAFKKSETVLDISKTNDHYSDENCIDEEFLPLHEFNAKYADEEFKGITDSYATSTDEYSLFSLSPVKTQTAQIIGNDGAIGTVTLQYQTQIIGGRPQFVYDTCYIGRPTAYNGWLLTESHATFSGDTIQVFATFEFSYFIESGVATFRPY